MENNPHRTTSLKYQTIRHFVKSQGRYEVAGLGKTETDHGLKNVILAESSSEFVFLLCVHYLTVRSPDLDYPQAAVHAVGA